LRNPGGRDEPKDCISEVGNGKFDMLRKKRARASLQGGRRPKSQKTSAVEAHSRRVATPRNVSAQAILLWLNLGRKEKMS